MSGFSDDGRWWWDGKTWVATAQVVLPQLPPTEFEQGGSLQVARERSRDSQRLFWTFMLALGWDVRLTRPERDFRVWTLQQLAFATAYLLGPDEPMLAGEVSMHHVGDSFERDLAVAVTSAHVVVFRIDYPDGQPRWIVLAGRAADVRMEARTGVFGLLWPALIVSGWSGRWPMLGLSGVFKAKPVLEAWRQAAKGLVHTG